MRKEKGGKEKKGEEGGGEEDQTMKRNKAHTSTVVICSHFAPSGRTILSVSCSTSWSSMMWSTTLILSM